jgi:rhamnosyltransferase
MSHPSGFMPGADLMEHCFSCLLYSNAFIKNVIETFGDNPRLGLLIPFTAMGGVNCNIANEWGEDYDNSKNMLREYFHIEDNELDKHPLVPFGGMFWVRAKALRTLIGYDWKHDDFPEGPLVNGNGLMTHTLDRLVSRLSQNDGFYTAFVAPGSYVNFYLGHLYFMNREIKSRLFDEIGSCQDLKLLRNLDDLHCDADSFSYWEKHRRKLELRYLGYKLLRRITVGDIRQEYKTKLLRLKIIRRSLKNRG